MPVKNICDCPDPPKGSVRCEPHQLAICGIINGQERRECLDPPICPSPLKQLNWILNQISEKSRTSNMPIPPKDIVMLLSGQYISNKGEVVNFILPDGIERTAKAFLEDLAKIIPPQYRTKYNG